jgi:hypothetical protein
MHFVFFPNVFTDVDKFNLFSVKKILHAGKKTEMDTQDDHTHVLLKSIFDEVLTRF